MYLLSYIYVVRTCIIYLHSHCFTLMMSDHLHCADFHYPMYLTEKDTLLF